MNSIKRSVMVSLLFILFSNISYSSDINIYFDPALSVTEISLEPYEATLGYIAVSGDSISDIAGWAGKISWSDSLLVFPVNYSSNCMNIRQFPEYELAYTQPITSTSGVYLLATINIFSLGSGSLCIAGIEPNSNPYYVSSNSLGIFNYLNGCQSKSSTSEIYNREIIHSDAIVASAIEYNPGIPLLLDSNNNALYSCAYDLRTQQLDLLNFGAILYASELCVIGTVTDVDYRCYDMHGRIQGYAYCVVNIDESLWGLYQSQVNCVIPVSNLLGCSSIVGSSWPDDINIGTQILLFGVTVDDIVIPVNYGVMLLSGDKYHIVRPSNGEFGFVDIYDKLLMMKQRRSYQQLAEHSDLVISAFISDLLPLECTSKLSIATCNVIIDKYGFGDKSDIQVYSNGRFNPQEWLSYVHAPSSMHGGFCTLYLKYDESCGSYYLVGGKLGLDNLED